MNRILSRVLALLVAATAAATLSACDPQITETAVRESAPATTLVAPVSVTEQQDRTYFACAAPLFGVYATYDQAASVAPAELAQVISSGRDIYGSYLQLPAGTSVELAAAAAGLDTQGEDALRCAVNAFGGVQS